MTPLFAALAALNGINPDAVPMAGDQPWHSVPGARNHFGPAIHARRPRAFNLRQMLRRYLGPAALGAFSLANLNAFPLAGAEAGDRAEIERVMVGTFPLTIGAQTIITKEFPTGDPWLAMTLNLRGELNSVAGPTGTVVADAPTTLWRVALTTDLDRDVVEPSISARALYRYAQIKAGTAGELVAPTLVASTVTPFNSAVRIDFVDNRLLVPEDSILDTRRYNSIVLTINTGVLTDIVTSPVNVTLQNCFVDVMLLRVSPRVPMPLDVVKVLPFYKQYAPIIPAGETIFNLDRIPTLAAKRFGFLATTGSTSGVTFTGTGHDGIIDTIRISSNRRDHFGSPIGGVSRRVLRSANKEDYAIETWPTGWYWADLVLDKSLLSALATGDLSVLQAILLYQGGLPATPQVSLFQSGAQKLRGMEGR